MGKNIILEDRRINNPECLLVNGSKRKYSTIAIGDIIWIKEYSTGGNFSFVAGKVLKWSMPRKTWTYQIETEKGTNWYHQSDFKIVSTKTKKVKDFIHPMGLYSIQLPIPYYKHPLEGWLGSD